MCTWGRSIQAALLPPRPCGIKPSLAGPVLREMSEYTLAVCDRYITITSDAEQPAALVRAGFGSMFVDAAPRSGAMRRYRIGPAHSGRGYRVTTDGKQPVGFSRLPDLLFHLDKDITIALQIERPDLYFLHAAVVALGERAVVLAAPSGSGKSTLALALAHDGFDYVSDELAPIDPLRRMVYPFPHALCLKAPPPAPYRLPTRLLRAGKRLYVPAESLGGRARTASLPIAAFAFLRRVREAGPSCRRISPGAAAAHMVANALNALAHPDAGLGVAASLGQSVPCFELDTAHLGDACQAIRAIL